MEKEFMNKADSKYIFAAFCLVIRKIHNDNNSLVHFPIFMDATCSGIQHLSALIKDYESASRVNLIEQSDDDNVSDIYGEIVSYVNEAINNYVSKDGTINPRFKKIKLTRKEIKTLVMTKPYNSKIYGMAQQLISVLNKVDLKNNGEYDPYRYKVPTKDGGFVLCSKSELFKIASIIDKHVFLMFPKLKEVYDFLLSISKILTNINIPITWFTPVGIKITQKYLKDVTKSVSIRNFGKKKTIVLLSKAVDKEGQVIVNTRKQVEGVIPNVIHSLDASHLMMIINENNNTSNYPIITNHDCFGTHPNDMSNLQLIVKKMFIKLYSEEYFLEKFYWKQIESIIDNNYLVLNKKDTKKDILNQLNKIFKDFTIKNKTKQLEDLHILVKNSFKKSQNIIILIDDDLKNKKKITYLILLI